MTLKTFFFKKKIKYFITLRLLFFADFCYLPIFVNHRFFLYQNVELQKGKVEYIQSFQRINYRLSGFDSSFSNFFCYFSVFDDVFVNVKLFLIKSSTQGVHLED